LALRPGRRSWPRADGSRCVDHDIIHACRGDIEIRCRYIDAANIVAGVRHDAEKGVFGALVTAE
jgi:hypothetical protein